MEKHKEQIICPECNSTENAEVKHSTPFWTYIHECSCGYIIMESDWQKNNSEEWTQERVEKSFQELGFTFPKTDEQLKAFDEKFKDYPYKNSDKKIDVSKIINEIKTSSMEYKTLKERLAVYEDALTKWGPEEQLKMAQEEATELALAIRKFTRHFDQKTADSLCGEIADMEIMTEQMNFMYPKFRKKIEEVKLIKLKRLRSRLDNNTFN